MILRRFAEALKPQNWAAIAIEFVLLVLGVFPGIHVANWNDDQKTQQREAEVIARLFLDFERIDARLTRNNRTIMENLHSIAREPQ